jgi:uncharacterized membrane protein
MGGMATTTATGSRYRTATGQATIVAFLLVLIFGSPWYVRWVERGDRGIFLETLAWPRWAFNTNSSLRDLLITDLTAILLIVFTAVFIALMAGSQLSRARGSFAAIMIGWGAYIFAAALAAFITSLFLANPSVTNATIHAESGASYGLIVGWVVGLATMAARRP